MSKQFKPLTPKQTQAFLELLPPMVQIVTTYKVCPWFNRKKNEFLYGVQMKLDGSWVNLSMDERALIFSDEETAKYVVSQFRKATNRLKRQQAKQK
jgi:hypothetical protein